MSVTRSANRNSDGYKMNLEIIAQCYIKGVLITYLLLENYIKEYSRFAIIYNDGLTYLYSLMKLRDK